MKVRFAVVPSAQISKQAIKLAKYYSAQGKHLYVVDGKKYFSHNTLFVVNVNKSKAVALVDFLNKGLNAKPLKLQIDTLWFSKTGVLGLGIKKDKALVNLRKNLIKKIEKSGLAKKVHAREPYSPHFTMTRFYKTETAAEIAKRDKIKKQNFVSKEILLGLSKQTGQVYKILNTIKLK